MRGEIWRWNISHDQVHDHLRYVLQTSTHVCRCQGQVLRSLYDFFILHRALSAPLCVCVFSCTLLTPCMVLNFSSHCRSWPDRIDPGHDWRFETPQTWKKSIITLCTMWSNSQRAIMLTNLSNMWDFPLPDHFEMKVSHLTDHRAVRGLMNWKHFPTWRWPLRYRVDALTRGLNLWLRQEGSRRKWQISSVTEAQIKWR